MQYNFENITDIASAAWELISRGNAVNLHVVIELGYRYDDITIIVYNQDENGGLCDRAFELREGGVNVPEKIASAFAELSEFLDHYTEDAETRLTGKISKLTEELKNAKQELKKVKKGKNTKKN